MIVPPVVVEPSLTAEPPCSSYETVKVFAVHTAYRVTFVEMENDEVGVRVVPVHVAPADG